MKTRGWQLFLASAALAACNKDMPSPPDLGPWSAAYAMAVTLQTNTAQATSLVFAVPSLAKESTADYSRAISIADTTSLFGIEGSGAVYATGAMSPTVTRYAVDAFGEVTPGPQLSFAGFGLGSSYSTRSIAFASPSKAYLLDDTTLQAITFDPSTMTVGKAIDLGALKRDGYHTNFAYNIPARGAQLVIAAFYYDATYSRTIPETAVALLDTATDMVTVVTDSRCGAFSTVAKLDNGDLYFGSDTYSVALHRIGGAASAPDGCLLRMKAGQDVFDPDFFVRVSLLTGGQLGGAAVAAGDQLWVRVFDESLFPVDATTSALAILAAPAWRWWKVDPRGPISATPEPASNPPGAGEVKTFTVEGKAYTGSSNQDYTMTTVLEMSSPMAPVAGLLVKGHPSGIVKAR